LGPRVTGVAGEDTSHLCWRHGSSRSMRSRWERSSALSARRALRISVRLEDSWLGIGGGMLGWDTGWLRS